MSEFFTPKPQHDPYRVSRVLTAKQKLRYASTLNTDTIVLATMQEQDKNTITSHYNRLAKHMCRMFASSTFIAHADPITTIPQFFAPIPQHDIITIPKYRAPLTPIWPFFLYIVMVLCMATSPLVQLQEPVFRAFNPTFHIYLVIIHVTASLQQTST